MKILSLFDGMSCGQIALGRAGISHDGYYASEIDKYAIAVTQSNYPDTVQLGSIEGWQDWAIDWADIGLIMAGSPCQGFSFAGKQLAFNDPRSKLFFVFADILKFVQSYKPDVKFMLENVLMKEESRQVITDILGVEPVMINSAIVSAQNRKRLYWANWDFGQPEDKGILLKDVIENGFVDQNNSYCIDANYYKGGNLTQYFEKHRRQLVFENDIKCARIVGRKINPNTGKRDDYNEEIPTEQRIEPRLDEKTGALTTVQKDNVLILQKARGNNPGGIRAEDGKAPCMGANSWQDNNHLIMLGLAEDSKQHDMSKRIYSSEGKSPTLLANPKGGPIPIKVGIGENAPLINNVGYRKLTPIECERLQTVDDNYTAHVSNTQRYRMLGNGWTVDVIAHVLRQAGI